jgi:hypothetical protein
MKMSISLGISVMPQDIATGLRALSSYLNKDKNALCLLLVTIYDAIALWGNKVNKFAVSQMTNQLQLTGQQMTRDDVYRAFDLQHNPYNQIVDCYTL